MILSSHHSRAKITKLCFLRGLPERFGLSFIHVADAKPFAKLKSQTEDKIHSTGFPLVFWGCDLYSALHGPEATATERFHLIRI